MYSGEAEIAGSATWVQTVWPYCISSEALFAADGLFTIRLVCGVRRHRALGPRPGWIEPFCSRCWFCQAGNITRVL